MFARTIEEVRKELGEQTKTLLVSRCRTGLWALLLSDCVFALGDLRLSPDVAGPLMSLKAVQALFVLVGFIVLRRPLTLHEVTLTAVVMAGSNCIVSAGVAGVRGTIEALPLNSIILAMATATLLPWGAWAQLAFCLVAATSVVWASLTVVGSVAPLFDYTGIAMLVALVVSVYVAFEFDRYRMAIEHRNLELRGYRDVVENANDAILTLDRDYRITGANRGAELIFGHSAQELLGRPMEILLAVDDAKVLRERWAEGFSGTVRETLLSLDARRKDGSTVVVEIKARTLEAGNGAGGLQAILRDVTEKRVVERMRNDFVAMLSHDLQTPLASILGFSEILNDGLGVSPELRKVVDRIEANARIAHSLAANFVEVARIENGSLELQLEKTSLNEIVDHVLRHQESMARAREIAIEATLAKDLPDLPLDRRHMNRVVSNLLSNAIKFSPRESRIRVRTTCENGRVVLAVRDEGPGIPAEHRRRLFERFRRVDAGRVEGSGLGLYIVKQIVEAHGGRVFVDCPAEGGSVFRVAFGKKGEGCALSE